jgi:cyclic pyranopterin phosphate synthase
MGSAPSGSDPGARGRLRLPVVAGPALAVPENFPAQPAAPTVDAHARPLRYLRVSVTDRCNFACTYCVPDGRHRAPGPRRALSFEELERVVAVFVDARRRAGPADRRRAHRARPRRRPGRPAGAARPRAGDDDQRPPPARAGAAAGAAGLRGVNVSLDTLDAARFARLTSGGDLAHGDRRHRRGDRAAGLEVKLNAVALAGENDGELAALCAFAWDRGVTLRFIEHMPLSSGALFQPDRELSAAAIRAALTAAFGPLTPGRPRLAASSARHATGRWPRAPAARSGSSRR